MCSHEGTYVRSVKFPGAERSIKLEQSKYNPLHSEPGPEQTCSAIIQRPIIYIYRAFVQNTRIYTKLYNIDHAPLENGKLLPLIDAKVNYWSDKIDI